MRTFRLVIFAPSLRKVRHPAHLAELARMAQEVRLLRRVPFNLRRRVERLEAGYEEAARGHAG